MANGQNIPTSYTQHLHYHALTHCRPSQFLLLKSFGNHANTIHARYNPKPKLGLELGDVDCDNDRYHIGN
jgi:hypothetical protein